MVLPRRGVVGTETLAERGLGVTGGLWKVTPGGGGRGSLGPFVGVAQGGCPGLGTFRRVREWERPLGGGWGESRLGTDTPPESAEALGSVLEGVGG